MYGKLPRETKEIYLCDEVGGITDVERNNWCRV